MPKSPPTYRTPGDFKPTLCVDFHGCIHSHISGNATTEIADDPPVPGAFEWLEQVAEYFKVVVVCARFGRPGELGRSAMKEAQTWFGNKGCRLRVGLDLACVTPIILAAVKPPCHVLLDDRALTFHGTFPAVSELTDFRPWDR
jgi:hypothetical protein